MGEGVKRRGRIYDWRDRPPIRRKWSEFHFHGQGKKMQPKEGPFLGTKVEGSWLLADSENLKTFGREGGK